MKVISDNGKEKAGGWDVEINLFLVLKATDFK